MGRPSYKEHIVAAAAELFHARGFNGCGVQEIADHAKVQKGSFYNHFKSKEALLLEVLERYRAGHALDTHAEPERAALERLRLHFEGMAEGLGSAHYCKGCLIGNLATEMADASPEVRGALADAMQQWSSGVAELLRQAQKEGALARHHHPETLGRFIVNAWQGVVARAKVDKSPAAFDDFFAVTFGSLLR